MAAILMAGAVELPCPVSLSVNDEIIWSNNTGRTASGDMTGDVIGEKKNLEIQWGVLPESEVKKIKDNFQTGFFPLTFRDDGVDVTISTYRGTLTKEHLGYAGDGIYYYRSVSASVIQQ